VCSLARSLSLPLRPDTSSFGQRLPRLPATHARAAEWLLTEQKLHQPLPIKSDPQTLLPDAVQTKDPAALFMAGEFYGALDADRDARSVDSNPSNSAAGGGGTESDGKLAWWLLACNHGYDCSENASWYERICVTDFRCQTRKNGED
jgi:hypothetical protein